MSPKNKSTTKAKAKAVAKSLADKKDLDTKQLIDKQDVDEDLPTRKLRRRDSDPQVKKIVYDNFRGWSDDEIYLREVSKCTLYDRLVKDRHTWKSGEIEMGPRYCATLRSEFANPDATYFKLKPTNPDDKQDDQLHAALTALIASKTQVSELFGLGRDCEGGEQVQVGCGVQTTYQDAPR